MNAPGDRRKPQETRKPDTRGLCYCQQPGCEMCFPLIGKRGAK